MLFRCLFFRTQQLGSGPADIPRILVFHCSHCDFLTNTVLGQFKKEKKTTHSKYAKQKTEEDKNPHSHNLLCAYKRLLFYKHKLFVSSFADVSVLHASLAAGKEKEQNPMNETLFNVPQFAGKFETVHYFIIIFYVRNSLIPYC